jgi:hypothetical protein
MDKITDGGPAFQVNYVQGQITIHDHGMSLRDWFAGQSLSLFYWSRPEPKDGESGQAAIARM